MIKKIDKHSVKEFLQKQGVTLMFIVICIVAGSYNSNFFTITNFMNVVRQLSITAIFAWAITILFIGGVNDLSGGSVMALSGVVAALVITHFNFTIMGVIIGMIAAVAVGALAGLINGFVIARYNLPAFIVTLTMMNIARGMAFVVSNGRPISSMPDAYKWFGQGSVLGIPVPLLIMALFFFIAWFLLYKTRFGRHVFAIGGNEQAAIAAGINVFKVKILMMVLGGVFAAVAGLVLGARLGVGQPTAAIGFEFVSMTMVVVGGTSLNGGKGSMYGTIVGALIVGFMSNVLNFFNVNVFWQQVVQGLLILVAILVDANIKRNN